MRLLSLALALLLAPALALANDAKGTPPTAKEARNTPTSQVMEGLAPMDRTILDKGQMTDARLAAFIHRVNGFEVKAGELAQKKATSASIRDYGRTLADDHAKADRDLTDVAKRAGLSLDDSALTATDKEKLAIEDNKLAVLERMDGKNFEVGFGTVLYNGHDAVIDMLNRHRGAIRSPELRKLVADTLPVLEHHRDLAEKLKARPLPQGRPPVKSPR